MTSPAVLSVSGLTQSYGPRVVLEQLSFEVATGELFGWLGPNGSGKTTLFRVLATLLPVQSGSVQISGFDVAKSPAEVRQRLGITFQSPSLDRQLTVAENLWHQGVLYGLSGASLQKRISAVLSRLGLNERRRELVKTLSGGLQRRVEIAKALLHHPQLLLLDEPSTGLDPGARGELWRYLRELREEYGITIIVTTHLLEEAELCDRLGILHQGQLVALGTPTELRQSVGGDSLTVRSPRLTELAQEIPRRWPVKVTSLGDALRIEQIPGPEWLTDFLKAYPGDVTSLTWGHPTLEDVFIQRTGKRFWEGGHATDNSH